MLGHVHQPARVMHMIEDEHRGAVQAVLRQLREAQRWIDSVPELTATGSRLAGIVYEIEEHAAERLLQSDAEPKSTA
jgi:ABC-type nitrate/sulfonate/bicarbonate transport system substrate-binding protein